MNRRDRINALQLEIAGLDSEIAELRIQHRAVATTLEAHEANRLALKYEVSRHKAILHSNGGEDKRWDVC